MFRWVCFAACVSLGLFHCDSPVGFVSLGLFRCVSLVLFHCVSPVGFVSLCLFRCVSFR